MGRLLALNAVFFLVPFAIYAAWLGATRRTLVGGWPYRVVAWLCLAGVGVMAAGLVTLTSFDSSPPGFTYRRAVIRDGQIVPGGFDEPEPAAP